MRATIDSAGRLVIPKEVRLRDGRIEIEPAVLDVTIRRRGRLTVAVPHQAVPPLTSEAVKETRRLRRERAAD